MRNAFEATPGQGTRPTAANVVAATPGQGTRPTGPNLVGRVPSRGGVAALFGLLFAVTTGHLHAQAERYEVREQHSPDGIGKFYMGREISHVMGHPAADWLERPERDQEEHTETLVELLAVKPGEIIADIGAGTGYFTRRLAGKVGAKGKVFAVDIQPEMLAILSNSMAELRLTNVVGVLGSITNTGLPAASIDMALMVDVYHEFSHPYEMMANSCQALKPRGRLIFVEFRGEDPAVPIKPLHKMTEAQVRREMSVHDLEWSQTITNLPRQHIIVFRKKK